MSVLLAANEEKGRGNPGDGAGGWGRETRMSCSWEVTTPRMTISITPYHTLQLIHMRRITVIVAMDKGRKG